MIFRIRKNSDNPYEITHQASLLLFDDNPLVVNPRLALIVGLNEAIILQQIHYWTQINTKANRNQHDNCFWTYNTLTQWRSQFPFWSERTIRRTLSNLIKLNLVVSNQVNKSKLDQTVWYRIHYDNLGILSKDPSKFPCGQNGHIDMDKLATSSIYTETNNTETNSEENTTDDLLNSIDKQDRLNELHWQAEQAMAQSINPKPRLQ